MKDDKNVIPTENAHQNKLSIDKRMQQSAAKLIAKSGVRKILAAVSGGADSVAMLHLLKTISERQPAITVEAANCNFHLRGDESNRDSKFVEELCRELGIYLHTIEFNTCEYASKNRLSIELACRNLRHEWFDRIMKQEGHDRLATGHNITDNIETFMQNLLRGSGTTGLRAMTPDNGRVIRPLLQFSRQEIMQYLQLQNLSHVEDSTNAQNEYSRNYLRHEILPRLQQRWKGANAGITKSIEILQRENKIIEQAIAQALSHTIKEGTNAILPWDIITQFADPQTLIFRFLQPYGQASRISEEISRQLPEIRIGSRWEIGDWDITAISQGLISEPRIKSSIQLQWEEIEITPRNSEEIWKKIKKGTNQEAWLPHGPEEYQMRKWNEGDRIRPLGMKGSRLCSDIIRESRKTPAERRVQTVLTRKKDGEIIWMPELKRSREELISSEMIKVWHVSISLQ